MATPSALILRAPGVNCDVETAFAFERAGAMADRVHVKRLRENPALLEQYQILVLPGGFSYGDDVAGGKILANQLSQSLKDVLFKFRDEEKLILGICNGFQALLKSGLIVMPDDEGPLVTLTANVSGKYEDRWTHLQVASDRCPFVQGIESMYLPVAHGEGRIVARESWQLQGLMQTGQVVLRYVDEEGNPGEYPINPNGSQEGIAGLCDVTGRVMGLMPHPERNMLPTHHPQWTRHRSDAEPDGMKIFRNAVRFFKV